MTKVSDHVISKEMGLKPTNVVLCNHASVTRIDISVFLILPKILFHILFAFTNVITRKMRVNYRTPSLY